ncbi:hypothetical protein O181_040687 [Austropuccinia psidii MF-1]|uniref:RNase H type-1 domain-containing protein n=1 Tax=Austropuccinia psidii MF-1 TaxID=1389203 RepID=A0A9Q3DJB9_9BASI|nr:hypothetical protein [Austropuccinia psidii MF-1]
MEDSTAEMLWPELPCTPPSHPSLLNLMLNKEGLLKCHQKKFESILTFPTPPWAQAIGPINNISLTKEQAKQTLPNQIKEEIQKGTLIFFSDGLLLTQQEGEAAAALVNMGKELKSYVAKDALITNFKTELMALLLCQVLLKEHTNTHGYPKEEAFFSNNQMALACAALPKKKSAAQHLQKKLYTNLQHLTKIFPVCLYWCPGHVGITENKKVDKLAKLAAESQITSHHTINTMSLSKLRQASKEGLRDDPLTHEEISRIKYKTPPKLINKALDLLEKGPAATIHQLQTNHVPSNDSLHQIKRHKSPNCQHCNAQDHYLLISLAFNDQRHLFTQQVAKHRIKLNPNSLKSILDYPLAFLFLAQYMTERKGALGDRTLLVLVTEWEQERQQRTFRRQDFISLGHRMGTGETTENLEE